MKIELEDGKYTLLQNDDGTGLRALRYGEEWRDLLGDNLVAALGHQIQDLTEDAVKQDDLIQKLLALLDLIDVQDDASLTKGRFDILLEYGEIIFGEEVSGRKQ